MPQSELTIYSYRYIYTCGDHIPFSQSSSAALPTSVPPPFPTSVPLGTGTGVLPHPISSSSSGPNGNLSMSNSWSSVRTGTGFSGTGTGFATGTGLQPYPPYYTSWIKRQADAATTPACLRHYINEQPHKPKARSDACNCLNIETPKPTTSVKTVTDPSTTSTEVNTVKVCFNKNNFVFTADFQRWIPRLPSNLLLEL
jgi:hypothetical protein